MNNLYTVERITETRSYYHFKPKTAAGGSLCVELIFCEDPGGKSSLPALWHKNGWAPEDVGNLERVRKTLELVFSQLDRLRVPFWVQNSVICWAEDWRDTLRRSTREAMQEKGINLQAL